MRHVIEAAEARVASLPPYSPDFKAIENEFSMPKARRRKAPERSVNGLWNSVGRISETYTPNEQANYFAACGYDPQ